MGENTKVVQQAYDCFKRGDLGTLLGLLTEDVEWVVPTITNVPYAGRWKGRDQVGRYFFASLAEHTEPLHFEPKEFVEEGDTVIGLGSYLFRVKATGKTYGGDFAQRFSLSGGKVSRFQDFGDTAAVEAAFRR